MKPLTPPHRRVHRSRVLPSSGISVAEPNRRARPTGSPPPRFPSAQIDVVTRRRTRTPQPRLASELLLLPSARTDAVPGIFPTSLPSCPFGDSLPPCLFSRCHPMLRSAGPEIVSRTRKSLPATTVGGGRPRLLGMYIIHFHHTICCPENTLGFDSPFLFLDPLNKIYGVQRTDVH
jgi:hypothetical protein